MAERSADPRPSVREAIDIAPVQRGAPEVVAGRDHLDRSVRWVHVAEARDVASVLRGGELLITEGRPFQGSDADQRRFVAELAERGIAGVILELGTHYASVPAELIKAFDEHEPAADRASRPGPVRRGHGGDQHVDRRSQSALLVEGEAVHRRLIELALGGAGVGEVLDAVAEEVGNPVLFERDRGGIAYEARGGPLRARRLRRLGALYARPARCARGDRAPAAGGPRRELLGRVVASGCRARSASPRRPPSTARWA